MDLKDKVALITGGTHGIGATIALHLAQSGTHVCLVGRNEDQFEIKKQIEAIGVKCLLLQADISKEEECKRVVEDTLAALGNIDILVHSAGSAAPGGLLGGARDVWYTAFELPVLVICFEEIPS